MRPASAGITVGDHWPSLIDSHGPFAGCRKEECRHADRLPVAPAPPDFRHLIG